MGHTVLIEGEPWDRGWGCGCVGFWSDVAYLSDILCRYRNYLMACAALMDQQIQPMYFPLLDTPSTPGVRNLQIMVERAWRDGTLALPQLYEDSHSLLHTGYDKEGAEDMRRDLVDTSKWIGTAGK